MVDLSSSEEFKCLLKSKHRKPGGGWKIICPERFSPADMVPTLKLSTLAAWDMLMKALITMYNVIYHREPTNDQVTCCRIVRQRMIDTLLIRVCCH